MDVVDLLHAARRVIDRAQICFLVTGQRSEDLHGRLMHPFPPDDDFTIWLGTSPRCRKIDDIRQGGSVLVAYSDVAHGAYATVAGNASLESSLPLRRQHWRETFREWWPDGPDSDDYVLIRLEPRRIELVSGAEHVEPEPKGLCAAVLSRQGERWRASTTMAGRDSV